MITGFAIDLGGTKTAAARILNGKIEERLQLTTDGQASFDDQIASIERLLASIGFEYGDRLGIAVAGRIDAQGDWHAVNTRTLSQIGGQSLLQCCVERFGNNVRVMNDAVSAGLAEAKLGAGQGVDHFAYLTVSTGVGGAVILNGRPITSRNGLAGHLGFMSSPYGNSKCGSGRYGTVEATASGKAIALYAKTADAKAAFEGMSEVAIEAIDRSVRAIATLCADLNAVLGLDRIAIGGSVGLADGYISRVQAHMANEPDLFQVPIVPAALGQDSALLGVLL